MHGRQCCLSLCCALGSQSGHLRLCCHYCCLLLPSQVLQCILILVLLTAAVNALPLVRPSHRLDSSASLVFVLTQSYLPPSTFHLPPSASSISLHTSPLPSSYRFIPSLSQVQGHRWRTLSYPPSRFHSNSVHLTKGFAETRCLATTGTFRYLALNKLKLACLVLLSFPIYIFIV